MEHIVFRSKHIGWREYELEYKIDDGVKIIRIPHCDDEFMNAFLSNYILRPSCYHCQFKNENYHSDITLGDFWNIDNVDASYNDDKGVSEVIIRSVRGNDFFQAIATGLDAKRVTKSDAIQSHLYNSASLPQDRAEYFKTLGRDGIKVANSKYIKKKKSNFFHRAFNKFLRITGHYHRKIAIKTNELNAFLIKEKKYDDFDILSSCVGCESCKNICPKNAITMVRDSEGFKYPHIDSALCIDCKLCETVCPVTVKSKSDNSYELQYYAAKNLDEKERLASSSGGVFSLLAKKILNEGGVVFGAVFSDSLEVSHESITDISEIDKLQGSKYIQSNINGSYKEALAYLKEWKKVLYSGTPCQIAGLKAFLRKDYENLITVDIICHGVPSSSVFAKYFAEIIEPSIKGIEGGIEILFRDKSYGWRNFSMSYKGKQNGRGKG